MITHAFKLFAVGTVLAVTSFTPAQSAVVTETWTYSAIDSASTGLNPATYGGSYRPAQILSDAATSEGSYITATGLTNGGLGSSGYPDGYGGIYTFFSSPVDFTLTATNALSNLSTLTLSFAAGGGFPALINFDADDVVLDFNLLNQNVTTLNFSKGAPFIVSTPIGDVDIHLYTWTWDVSSYGASSGFSFQWSTLPQHAFLTDFTLVQTQIQAVPEPSTAGLIGIGAAFLFWVRNRRQKLTSI